MTAAMRPAGPGARSERRSTSSTCCARMLLHPPVRGEGRRAVQRRQDPRLSAPVHRRGGRGGRRHAGADARGQRRRHLPRARPRAGARACPPAPSWPRCTARPTAAAAAGAARCTCSTSRPPLLRRLRHRRRRAADRRGAGPRRPAAAAPPGHRLLLRRRRRRRRRVPRVAQPRGALEAAGALPVREQPVRHGHRARPPPGADRHRPQGGGVRRGRPSAVDGMDVLAVEAAARRAAEPVRRDGRPFLLELRTYRFRAHSMYDPDLYRTKEEVERWKQRDPIALLRARLEAAGRALAAERLAALEREVDAEVAAAVADAEAGAARAGRATCSRTSTRRRSP